MNNQRECLSGPRAIYLSLQGLNTIKLHQRQLVENGCEVKLSVAVFSST